MTNRENRRFIKSQIAETQHLKELVAGHPFMAPLLEQREAVFREELTRTSFLTQEPRTIMFFSGDPVFGSRGIDASFAADILSPFSTMVKTEYASEKHGQVGERGPRKDEGEARLLITGLPRGSFGIELSQPQSDTLFAEEQISNVLARLTGLFDAAGKSDEDFANALKDVSPRIYGGLKDFFRVLKTNHATLRMQTGNLEFSLEQQKVEQAFSRVSSVKTESQEVERQGVFRGATLDAWKFNFREVGGETLRGSLGNDLNEDDVAEMNKQTNQLCIAKLNEIKITTSGDVLRYRYELLELRGQ